MSRMSNVKPLILSLSLIVCICILSSVRLRNESVWVGSLVSFDVVFPSTYLLWMLLELRVAKREIYQGEKRSDFGTCEFYALSQALTFLSALWFDSLWSGPHLCHFLGFALFLLGICLRLWAIQTLGKCYSHMVREVDEHRIIDSGPYRYIRHPAYAGMMVANTGIAIHYLNWVTLALFLFLLIPSIILRIFVEEKTLYQMEGYPDFAKTRKRLFPALW